MGKPLVQHEINDHTGDADVHPERPCPAGNDAMPVIPGAKGAAQRDYCQWNYDHRQDDVRAQNREVNRSRPSLPQKKNVSDFVVEENVTGQEQRGSYYRRNHARPVSSHSALGNQNSPRDQQSGACAIESCIKGREVRVLLGNHAAGLVVRRFAISRASPNITNENRISVAIADESGKLDSDAG